MDKEIALKILRELHDKALFSERTALETFIPELKESEDERIRKDVYNYLYNERHNIRQLTPYTDELDRWLAWLEKQKPINISIEDKMIKKSLINYVKAHGNGGDFTKEKYIAWLEKQGDTSEIVNKKKIASDILRGAAINLITWIDYNAAEGNMCLSNMECKDIEDALVSGDWDKIYAYIKKKLEKQGEQKPMTEEFEHELAEICNQLLSEIDSEWMNNEILDCIGTSVWLNLCDETAKRYKDGLLKLAKQGEQKPAEWGEEDETTFKVMLEELEKYVMFKQYSTPLSVYDLQWFKSLKDRVQPQPKQEWSVEDETGWTNTMNMIKEVASNHYTKDSIKLVIDWLESLKQRIGG